MSGEATAKEYNPWMIAMVVSLAAFMEVLDTTITNVSLSHIAGTLGASQDESTWIITSYLVANGIVLPLSGWLAGVMGRKNFFMFSIAAFTAASFACGVSTSLVMLIFFRLIQGFAGGGLQPIQQAIILDAFPPEKRAAAFGITGITMIVAPILGPTLGGYITDNFSWQWIFLMNVPVGIIALFLVRQMVQDPPHARAKGLLSIDYIGLGLISIGLGTLQIVLDKGQQDDWFGSNFIVLFAIISFTCLVSAIFWMLNQKDPVVDLRLLADRHFGLACFMIFFVGVTLYGGSTLLPLMVQSEYGYDATLAGLVLSPSGFFVILLMPIAGKLVSKIPSRYLIAFGMFMCGIGMIMGGYVTPQSDYHDFLVVRVFQVLGLPFLFIPVSTLAFVKVPKEKSSNASAIFAMARNLGGSIGIAVMTSYLVRREQVHQSYISQHLSPADQGYTALLAQYKHTIISHGSTMLSATQAALARIYQQLIHQSDVMAFADCFYMLGIIMWLLVFVAFLMPYNNPRIKPSAEAVAAH